MVRSIDIAFGADEKVWRRVEPNEVRSGGKLKPGSLRLQVSVVRERHGALSSVTQGKWNGVYVVTAAQAAASNPESSVQFVCVDDPLKDQGGHALVAFIATPGTPVPPEQITAARQVLADRFTCLTPPKR